jgi:hypothetical protein
MMTSTTWCSPCLVILPCRPQSTAWRRAVGPANTIAEPSEWSIGPALHCSHIIATCPHLLQALTMLPARTSYRVMMALTSGTLENMHACVGNRQALPHRQAC